MKERKRKFSLQMTPVFRIGWHQPPSHQDIVDQSKNLCGHYIRFRLRKCCDSSLAGKKFSLQRLRSATNLKASNGSVGALSEVSVQLRRLCGQLETTHPKLFCSVVANVGLQGGGSTPPSELAIHNLFTAVADSLLLGCAEPDWGRVVALYALSGAMAMDCIKLGRSDLLLKLVDTFGGFVERELVDWIAGQGGWEALLDNFCKSRRFQVKQFLVYLAIPAVVGMASYFYCFS